MSGYLSGKQHTVLKNMRELCFLYGLVLKNFYLRSSHGGSAEINPTGNHEVVGSKPGLIQ